MKKKVLLLITKETDLHPKRSLQRLISQIDISFNKLSLLHGIGISTQENQNH